jgi:hypothetical protein
MNAILYFYWMLFLLLSAVNNTTIFLMALLNAIDQKNKWSLYTAALLSNSWQLIKGPHGLSLWPALWQYHIGCSWHSQCSTTMKRSGCCEGWYCQLCLLVLLLPGTTLSLFHGDQLGQSNLRGTIWSLSHPVINNISCCVVQPCQRCSPRRDTKGLWPTHLLW